MNYTIENQQVQVRFPDGEVRVMTPLGFRVMRNELKKMKTGPPGKPGVKPRTHCSHGHPLAGDNVRIYKYVGRMQRHCVTCERERNEKKRAAREAARQEVA